MFRIDIGFVGVKRTERIGGVHTGTPAVVRNDIDSPAECVTAQFDRYDTFVHLHTFGETYRNIVQPESGTHTVHRYTVDEDFTCRPEKPFKVTLASEPTPPVERIFTPLILSMTLDRSIVVLFNLAVSTNDTL